MSQGAPAWIEEYGDTTAREEGNATHWLAHENSQGIVHELGTPAAVNGLHITADMQAGADLYLDTCRSIGCADMRFEQRISIPTISANCAGTPDAAGVGMGATGRPFIFIGDLKFGRRVVEVWPNYQLITYGTGIAHLMGWQDWSTFDFIFGIVQPRAYHRAGPVRFHTGPAHEVLPQVHIIRNAIQAAESPNPALVPGDHCDYCPGRGRCPALDRKVSAFSFEQANDLTTAQAEAELEQMLAHQKLVEARVTGLSAQVEHALKSGERTTRFERVATKGALAWNPAHESKVRDLVTLLGKPGLVKEAPLITPTQAKKLLPAGLIEAYSQRLPGAVKLVPADPSRWVKLAAAVAK